MHFSSVPRKSMFNLCYITCFQSVNSDLIFRAVSRGIFVPGFTTVVTADRCRIQVELSGVLRGDWSHARRTPGEGHELPGRTVVGWEIGRARHLGRSGWRALLTPPQHRWRSVATSASGSASTEPELPSTTGTSLRRALQSGSSPPNRIASPPGKNRFRRLCRSPRL